MTLTRSLLYLTFSSLKISELTVWPVLLHSLSAFLFSDFTRWRSSENQGYCGLIVIDFSLDGACLFSTLVSCVSYISKRSVTGRLSSRSSRPCAMSVLKLGRLMERKALVIISVGVAWGDGRCITVDGGLLSYHPPGPPVQDYLCLDT